VVHLADGILEDTSLLAGVSCLGAAAVVVAMTRVRRCTRGAAWTGALAAFVLAAQAVNVPVVPGASAHVVGAGLMTIAVGPARAIVGMFAVLIVQALLFADGGVTALFVNTLNLAVIPVLVTHLLRVALKGVSRGRVLAAGLGTLLGNVLGAASLATLLVVGAGAPALVSFGWLVGVQAAAGAVEGVLASLSVAYLLRRAPALMASKSSDAPRALDERAAPPPTPLAGLGGLLLLLGAAVLLLPFASEVPDALEVLLESWERPQ